MVLILGCKTVVVVGMLETNWLLTSHCKFKACSERTVITVSNSMKYIVKKCSSIVSLCIKQLHLLKDLVVFELLFLSFLAWKTIIITAIMVVVHITNTGATEDAAFFTFATILCSFISWHFGAFHGTINPKLFF